MIPTAKLQQKVNDVIRTFPWYKEMVKDREVRELSDLPLLTADVLERHYYNQTVEDPSLAVYQTSGTSSKMRKKIVYSAEDDRRYLQLKAQLFADFLRGSGVKKALADMGTGHAANTATQIFGMIGLEHDAVSYQLPVAEHIAKLSSFRPELLYTMPSLLDNIVYAAEDPAAFGIRKIILVGEIAAPQWIARMAEAFRIDVRDIMDTYGSIELGTIACFSHDLQRYVFVDGMVAEGLQAHEADPGLAEAGELGDGESILVLTSFERRMFPALRFVTYDVVRDLRTEAMDGGTVQSFRSIVKRVGRELKHGEKISIYDIEEVVYRHVPDAAIRVQVRDNRLTVQIRSKALDDETAFVIREELQNQIPEIGTMIRGGMLAEIEVAAIGEGDQLLRGTVKNKKLYTDS
jgi:phenylacetate-coenzyme A ligase PaaK-like adenylate-forming protein